MHIVRHYNYIPFARITQVTMLQKMCTLASRKAAFIDIMPFFLANPFSLDYHLAQFCLTSVRISFTILQVFLLLLCEMSFLRVLASKFARLSYTFNCNILYLLEILSFFLFSLGSHRIKAVLKFTFEIPPLLLPFRPSKRFTAVLCGVEKSALQRTLIKLFYRRQLDNRIMKMLN